MRNARITLWIGLALYLLSFALPAIVLNSSGTSTMPGFECAWFAFRAPWGSSDDPISRIEWISIAFSGWVNPVFWAAMLTARKPRAFRILRITVLCMIPFCWVFFKYEGLYPREGHFAWVAGMLLALYSTERVQKNALRSLV
jgi:hypothetical protein